MKKIPFTVIFTLMLIPLSFSQLRLESENGKWQVTLPTETKIGLALPTETWNEQCECYKTYTGILKDVERDFANLLLLETDHVFEDSNRIASRTQTKYKYLSAKIKTPVPLLDLKSVTIYHQTGKDLDILGGLMMFFSAVHGLVVAPFLSDDARNVSDKIVWGGLGAGFVMTLFPNKKTYYLQQPKGKQEELWRIVRE
ncbi:MAG: hypothetical protein R2830_23430 [Saprospiraceae bacterium]